jgi:aspartyl-tRNA(Asn)/glutamyl-tRNA(Gln) amidotransferase subunit A
MTALAIARALHSGETTAEAVLDTYFSRIAQRDTEIRAFISIDKESAYRQARAVQAHIDRGDIRSPLAGVPLAVKDVLCTKGTATTCASKMLENFLPPYDATVIRKVRDADMIMLGKTNMDEFAMGSTTETSYFGVTRNPHNLAHVPGGSSGGSAAAVAAGFAPLALGSDTGGSIRQPAAYCGVYGLKPSYGAVSRYGLIAYCSSLDQVGPIGQDAADCAALMAVISGEDDRDSTTRKGYAYKTPAVKLKGLRIGIPQEFMGAGLSDEIRGALKKCADVCKEKGAEIVDITLPALKYAVPTYYILACAEAGSNLSRYDGIKYGHRSEDAADLREIYIKSRSEGFGMEVKRRVMLGNFVLSSGYYDAYYNKALQGRKLIQDAYFAAFAHCDFLLAPVAPAVAPKIGESLSDPLKMYLSDIYTVTVNLAGLPAVAFPCGKNADGLPLGLQLIGQPFEDAKLTAAAGLLGAESDVRE